MAVEREADRQARHDLADKFQEILLRQLHAGGYDPGKARGPR